MLKRVGISAQNMLTIIGSTININWDDLYDHFDEHENLHFDNAYDIHMTFIHYKPSGHRHDLELTFILHSSYM